MDDRTSLMRAATWNHPMAMAGNMMDFTPSLPDVGSHPNSTAKIHINTMPSQNAGRLCPNNATSFPPKSNTLPRRTAEITPMGIAITVATPRATRAKIAVAGRRSITKPMEEFPRHLRDSPKLPVAAFLRKIQYWVVMGLSNPHAFSTRIRSSSSASKGRRTSRGFPVIRPNEKMIIVTAISEMKA